MSGQKTPQAAIYRKSAVRFRQGRVSRYGFISDQSKSYRGMMQEKNQGGWWSCFPYRMSYFSMFLHVHIMRYAFYGVY
jgi:hypothetical protein